MSPIKMSLYHNQIYTNTQAILFHTSITWENVAQSIAPFDAQYTICMQKIATFSQSDISKD